MRAFRARTRLFSWIAVVAMLLSSLAPAMSHALHADEAVSWVEVCTIQGSKWVQADEDGSARIPASSHLLEHCPYCALHVPTLGLPPAGETAAPNLGLTQALPLAFLFAPRTLHAWLSAQPRAPPLFS